MPEFPRYESKGQINVRQPAFLAPEDNTGNMIAEAGNKIGGAVVGFAAKWQNTNNEIQKTAAENKFKIGMIDIQTRAEADPDYNNSGQYFKEIEKLRTDSLKGFSDKAVQDRMALDFNLYSAIGSDRINNTFKKKIIDAGRAEAFQSLDILSNDPSTTPEMIKENVNNWVSAGLFDRADTKKLVDQGNRLKVMHEIVSDFSTNVKESKVFQELQKKSGGNYDFLDPIVRDELLKKSLTQISENKRFLIEQTVDNRLQVLKDFAENKIDWKNSEGLINQLTIQDPELGEAIRKGTDTLFMADPDDEAFVEATQKVFAGSSKEEISTYLMHVLNQNANKEISRDRLAILINAAVERTNGLQTQAQDHPATQSPKQIEIGAAVRSLANSNPLFSSANMIVNFFKRVNDGASPREAHDEAVKAETNRTNPLSIKYKLGDIITNTQGVSGEVVGFNENGSPIIRRRK